MTIKSNDKNGDSSDNLFRSKNNHVEVVVCGINLKLVTTETTEYVQSLANAVTEKVMGIFKSKPSQGIDLSQRLVLSAMMIEDDRKKMKSAYENEIQLLKNTAEATASETGALRADAEKAKKEAALVRAEFERVASERFTLKQKLEKANAEAAAAKKELDDWIAAASEERIQ